MPNVLSFNISFLRTEGDRVHLKAVPVVDGCVLDANDKFAFDFALLAAARIAFWTEVWPFTCDICGDPGCARVEDPIELEMSAGHLTWVIPESLRPKLNPTFHGEGQLRLTFDDEAYSAQLDRVMAAVRDEALRLGRNVDLTPWNMSDGEPVLDPDAHVEKVIFRRRWLEWRHRVWAALDDMQLELEFPSGYVHSIGVETLANLFVGKGRETPWTEEIGQDIEANVAPRLKAGLEPVVELAMTLGWPTVLRVGFPADRSPEGLELSELERLAGWPEAKLSLTTHSQRYPSDRAEECPRAS